MVDTQGVALVQFHTIYGLPIGTPETNTLIARPIYCLSNNRETKFADWVAYRVDAQTVSGNSVTKRNWKADPDLAEDETLEPDDYRGASDKLNTDRGHQAPLASFKGTDYWYMTNYLSNITPQKKDLNQGAWKAVEDQVRELALKQPVYVVTGPLYEREMEALPGADEPHRVPSGYWKIVAVQNHGEFPLLVTAYIFDQATGRKSTITEHVVTVDEVERRAGLDFFWTLPDDIESVVESSISPNVWQ
ncbi:hypothetical protein AWY79_15840 [Pseudodesulfovibrio indicus]|uniref:Endonuclease n=1 Tax=Pseudodesulfovibrio indicus TaxID=1716143 RepID=A0ABM5Z050_9BACT|nr:hypothetical protein AWY79_15840 [Pseudodesulfovibrio indicus]